MANEMKLDGLRVAILVAEGFEQSELEGPKLALDKAGAQTKIVSPVEGEVQAWKHYEKADRFPVDVPLESASAEQFDALMLPGGVANPDQLRSLPAAVEFVRAFFDAGKPVAAICHAPWTLINAGVVRDRTLTSWPSLKADLMNAGARWVDQAVVTDNGLITSRKPDDIPAFNEKMLEEFAEGWHERQAHMTHRRIGQAASSRDLHHDAEPRTRLS